MSRTPVQSRLIAALESARTSEPYPVWVTWWTLSKQVYGHASERGMLNLRRAATAAGLQGLKYADGKCAGARFYPSSEEGWLLKWTLKVTGRENNSADFSAYVAPSKEEILLALRTGLAQRRTPRWLDVARAVKIVNECCGTTFDPGETAWSVVDYQMRWDERRIEIAQRLAGAMNALHDRRHRQEKEQRMISVGPFRIDPVSEQRCPCCQQEIQNGFPVQVRTELLGVG
ncbi:hypothetical protein [Streptomyces afghaniensis]|uniref:hypothetical protein n=1 Tax=Streptomyces afghaniensis TaxID=66865 RepID=UPI002781DD83|nr:hypothetical protein [Streptomyces afghaniensis]MDQ1017659.1 hypothetical protein [Streptomyces afghaniensis]